MEDPFDGLPAELQTHYRNMQDDLYDGLTPKVVEATNQALAWGQSPANILAHGLVAGMDAVGKDFGAGILFVPEVLRAANAMKAAMEILRPLLVETGVPKVGTAVIGTVKGDIHDIGKNLVGMMWEGAGFEVINLGVNVDADKFIAAIRAAQRDAARHVGAAHDDHALHAEGHRAAGGRGAAGACQGAGGRRAAQPGLRRGCPRRPLLPGRGGGGRGGAGDDGTTKDE